MLRRVAVLIGSLIIVVPAAPVAAGGGGCHGPLTDEEGTTVMMTQFCFTPMVVRVAEGETVTWENTDSVEHNVVSSAMPEYGTATLRQGDSASITFEDAGVYPYVCSIHPGMTGAVVVGDADTPPSNTADGVDAAAGLAGATKLDAVIEQRLTALERVVAAEGDVLAASAVPSAPGEQPSWPPLTIGLLAGLVIGALVQRVRRG